GVSAIAFGRKTPSEPVGGAGRPPRFHSASGMGERRGVISWIWIAVVAASVLLVPLIALTVWLWRSGISRPQASAFLRASGLDLVRMPGRLRRLAGDPRVPRRARWWLIGLALYVASPIDPIPDFIPVLGLLDEVFVVPVVLLHVKRIIAPDVWAEYFPPRPTGEDDR
ncbi:MAG: DUF1232 domain-containing protein, partial [Chloroflexota bacterium]|nr:DUF1232 domain-containing protein [Chloroflexota bacterium]